MSENKIVQYQQNAVESCVKKILITSFRRHGNRKRIEIFLKVIESMFNHFLMLCNCSYLRYTLSFDGVLHKSLFFNKAL